MTRLLSAIAALSLLGAPAVHAQDFLLGARYGVTTAVQTLSNPNLTYEPIRATTFGVVGGLELTQWASLQAEAMYVRKGGRQAGYYEMRLGYVETPLLLRLATPFAFRGARAFLAGGVAPALELTCGGYTTPPTIGAHGNPPGTVSLRCAEMRRYLSDRGRVFGGGLLLDWGGQQFTIETRRTRGRDISGSQYTQLRNDVTSIVFGVARR